LCLGTRKIFQSNNLAETWQRVRSIVLEQEILMMQHWPWALSPETPPIL
jgi:hypothetical protein